MYFLKNIMSFKTFRTINFALLEFKKTAEQHKVYIFIIYLPSRI